MAYKISDLFKQDLKICSAFGKDEENTSQWISVFIQYVHEKCIKCKMKKDNSLQNRGEGRV